MRFPAVRRACVHGRGDCGFSRTGLIACVGSPAPGIVLVSGIVPGPDLSMETAMDRAQKQVAIEALKGVFDGAGAVVVTHNLGLTVAEMTDLRGRLRKEGAQLKVVKNTLAQKALDGSIGEKGDALFAGPVAIAFAPDPVSAAKVATQFAKENEKFAIIGGFMGTEVLDKSAIGALATLPSLDQLRAKIIGLLLAPATKIAGVLQAPGAQVARVIGAYAAKDAA
jgi:large subunit ribosomal protein L10